MDPRLYALHADERERVANYFEPGMPTDRLLERDDFGSWKVLKEDEGEWIMQHYNGAIMRVDITGSKANSYTLVVGADAIALEKKIKG